MGFHNLRRREAPAGSAEAGESTLAGVLRAAGVHAFATRELRLSYRVRRDFLHAISVLPRTKASQIGAGALVSSPIGSSETRGGHRPHRDRIHP